MLRVGQGYGRGTETRAAARHAAERALVALGAEAPAVAWLFVTEQYDPHAAFTGVRDVVGPVPVVGCQAPGVLVEGRATHDGVAVLLLAGEVRVHVGVACEAARDGYAAGLQAAEEAVAACEAAGGDLADPGTLLVVITDAITANSCDVVRGVDTAVGAGVAVAGGGAGDNLRFCRTWQFAGDCVVEDAVMAVLIERAGRVGIGLRHGCEPRGDAMKVTRANGKLVEEIDFSPAFDRYRGVARELGQPISSADFQRFAIRHPFGIPAGDDRYVLRCPMMLGESGAIQCCAEMPCDGVVRVMEADRDGLLAAAREAGAVAAAGLGGRAAALGLVFACISREVVLGEAGQPASAEIAAVRAGLGGAAPIFGCLSMGQIGTFDGGAPQFHSKSIQVCAFAADAA